MWETFYLSTLSANHLSTSMKSYPRSERQCVNNIKCAWNYHNFCSFNIIKPIIAIKIGIGLDRIALKDEMLKVSSSTISEFSTLDAGHEDFTWV